MGFELTKSDEDKLVGVHADLVRFVRLGAQRSVVRFKVVEGLRTLHRQRQLLAKGATRTLNSRHLTGHAVDLVPMLNARELSWHWPHYHALAPVLKRAAADLQIALDWGGDWKSFKDGPHWELRWSRYPKGK